jgi:two-component system OmpR family response regulator
MSIKKPTILVIDDSEAVLSRVKERLEAAGFPVIATTQTVGTARHLNAASIVILDFHMPGIDGETVLASLRRSAQSFGRKVSFYLYTSDEQMTRRAKQLGFDGAFRNKGDLDALLPQVETVARLVALQGVTK